ncbi:MAG TPA: aspartate/glutamate racemase family protein, partial [Novosphingobium sp.]|nr:aspartate/glutamate racemase family protein [Novosphingobium sp.]
APRPEVLAHLPAGTQLKAFPSRVGVFPATPVERAMQDIGHIEAGIAAAQAGMAALVIDSFADYGIAALREAVACPVVGAGEAGLAAAAPYARFAIVTVWPASMNFLTQDLLRRHGMEARCTGILNIGEEAALAQLAGPEGYLGQIGRAEVAIIELALAAISEAKKQGAETVVLGCTCMSPMAAILADKADLPIISPLAEAAMRAAALAITPPAQPVLTPRADLLRRMVDAIAGEEDESCPVCAVAAFAP